MTGGELGPEPRPPPDTEGYVAHLPRETQPQPPTSPVTIMCAPRPQPYPTDCQTLARRTRAPIRAYQKQGIKKRPPPGLQASDFPLCTREGTKLPDGRQEAGS